MAESRKRIDEIESILLGHKPSSVERDIEQEETFEETVERAKKLRLTGEAVVESMKGVLAQGFKFISEHVSGITDKEKRQFEFLEEALQQDVNSAEAQNQRLQNNVNSAELSNQKLEQAVSGAAELSEYNEPEGDSLPIIPESPEDTIINVRHNVETEEDEPSTPEGHKEIGGFAEKILMLEADLSGIRDEIMPFHQADQSFPPFADLSKEISDHLNKLMGFYDNLIKYKNEDAAILWQAEGWRLRAEKLISVYKSEVAVIGLQEKYKGKEGTEFLDIKNIKNEYGGLIAKLAADFNTAGKKWGISLNEGFYEENFEDPRLVELCEKLNISEYDLEKIFSASNRLTADQVQQESEKVNHRDLSQMSIKERAGVFVKKVGAKFSANMAVGMAISAGITAAGITGGAGFAAAAVGMTGWRMGSKYLGNRWTKARYRKQVRESLAHEQPNQEILDNYTNNVAELLRVQALEKLQSEEHKESSAAAINKLQDEYINGLDKAKYRTRFMEIMEQREDLQGKEELSEVEAEQLRQMQAAVQTQIMTDSGLDMARAIRAHGEKVAPNSKKQLTEVIKQFGRGSAYGLSTRLLYQLPYVGKALAGYSAYQLTKLGFETIIEPSLPEGAVFNKIGKNYFALVAAGAAMLAPELAEYLHGEETGTSIQREREHAEETVDDVVKRIGSALLRPGSVHGEPPAQSAEAVTSTIPDIFDDDSDRTSSPAQEASADSKAVESEPLPLAEPPSDGGMESGQIKDKIDEGESVWASTRAMLLENRDSGKFNKEFLAFSESDQGDVEKWAERQTANLISDWENGLNKKMPNVVHAGDSVFINIEKGTPEMRFVNTSGMPAAYDGLHDTGARDGVVDTGINKGTVLVPTAAPEAVQPTQTDTIHTSREEQFKAALAGFDENIKHVEENLKNVEISGQDTKPAETAESIEKKYKPSEIERKTEQFLAGENSHNGLYEAEARTVEASAPNELDNLNHTLSEQPQNSDVLKDNLKAYAINELKFDAHKAELFVDHVAKDDQLTLEDFRETGIYDQEKHALNPQAMQEAADGFSRALAADLSAAEASSHEDNAPELTPDGLLPVSKEPDAIEKSMAEVRKNPAYEQSIIGQSDQLLNNANAKIGDIKENSAELAATLGGMQKSQGRLFNNWLAGRDYPKDSTYLNDVIKQDSDGHKAIDAASFKDKIAEFKSQAQSADLPESWDGPEPRIIHYSKNENEPITETVAITKQTNGRFTIYRGEEGRWRSNFVINGELPKNSFTGEEVEELIASAHK